MEKRIQEINSKIKSLTGLNINHNGNSETDFNNEFINNIEILISSYNELLNKFENLETVNKNSESKHNIILSILESLDVLVIISDHKTKEVMYSNARAKETILSGDTELYPPLNEIQIYLEDDSSHEHEIYHIQSDRWFAIKSDIVKWDNIENSGIQIVTDITDIKKKQKELEMRAHHDMLTGAYNRTWGIEALQSMINGNCLVSVAFIDMDGLKYINDTFGHTLGDYAICSLVRLINLSIRGNDLLCRLGGDEFMIIFYDLSKENAEKVLGRITENIDKFNDTFDGGYLLSMSYGIAESTPEINISAEDMILQADEIMYTSKNKKKIVRGEKFKIGVSIRKLIQMKNNNLVYYYLQI